MSEESKAPVAVGWASPPCRSGTPEVNVGWASPLCRYDTPERLELGGATGTTDGESAIASERSGAESRGSAVATDESSALWSALQQYFTNSEVGPEAIDAKGVVNAVQDCTVDDGEELRNCFKHVTWVRYVFKRSRPVKKIDVFVLYSGSL